MRHWVTSQRPDDVTYIVHCLVWVFRMLFAEVRIEHCAMRTFRTPEPLATTAKVGTLGMPIK